MTRYLPGLLLFIMGCTSPTPPPADLGSVDASCWTPHQCVNPACCAPSCKLDSIAHAPCPPDPCLPGDYCTYFESYCQCGTDKHWTYKNTGVRPDLALPIDLSPPAG